MDSSSNLATRPTNPEWSILGAGSIGGLWAASLVQAGISTRLLLRDDQAHDQYQKTPLSLRSGDDFVQPAVDFVTTKNLRNDLDWLLVTTKSFDALAALDSVAGHIVPTTKIILLLNGLGVQQAVVEQFSNQAVIAGTTTDGAFQQGRFQIIHAGRGETRFGRLANCSQSVMDELEAQLDALPLDAYVCEDIATRLWHKVAINSCVNALTALYECRNGALLDRPDAIAKIRMLAKEVEQVMLAENIKPPAPTLFAAVTQVLEATADNYSSMHQDVKAGRTTEIDQINGFICERAKRHGVATPENAAVLNAIKSL